MPNVNMTCSCWFM